MLNECPPTRTVAIDSRSSADAESHCYTDLVTEVLKSGGSIPRRTDSKAHAPVRRCCAAAGEDTADEDVSQKEPRSAVPLHVTFAVYEQPKHRYDFESRGEIEVKGKGKMQTWMMLKLKRMHVPHFVGA
jgi:hypothetical protein